MHDVKYAMSQKIARHHGSRRHQETIAVGGAVNNGGNPGDDGSPAMWEAMMSGTKMNPPYRCKIG